MPERLSEMARDALRARSEDPVPSHEDGRVRSTILSIETSPLVIDANMLRSEILRVVRADGSPTRLITASSVGAIRLYCARHVVEEVDEHLTEWSQAKRLDPLAAATAWETTHRRLLVCVDDDPSTVFVGDEAWRLEVLQTCEDRRFGDPDDVPTARLALALGAPVLSKDGALLRAVYGHGYDTKGHQGWLPQFGAMGELQVLGQLQLSSAFVVQLFGVGASSLLRRYPAMIAAAALGVFLGLTPDQRRSLGSHAVQGLKKTVEFVGALGLVISSARQLAELLPRPATDPEAAAHPRRAMAAAMARMPDGSPTLEELQRIDVGTESTADLLRRSPMFVDLGDGTFQLGRPVV
jgi:predicted nucleic acid-binding protein